MEANKNEDVYI